MCSEFKVDLFQSCFLGTTVEYTGSAPEVRTTGGDNLALATGINPFVGGASNGKHGVSGMVYERLLVNVTCKKAWMFFDDEIVAMATDVDAGNAKDTNAVVTTLNQIIKSGTVTVKDLNNQYFDFESGKHVVNDPIWLHHDSTGYVMVDGFTNVHVKIENKNDDVLDVFTAYTDHGIQPQKINYAYVIKPSTTQALAMDDYVTNIPIRIIRNDHTVQATFHAGINVSSLVIYEPATVSLPTGKTIA